MRKTTVLLTTLLFCLTSSAQLAVSNAAPYNVPTYLVNNVLLGNGVSASNITYTGNPAQIGFFTGGLNGAPNLGLDSGLVMSSGDVNDIAPGGNQPNTGSFSGPGDPDLLSIAQSVTSNPNAANITQTQYAAFLEFDFTPAGDSVQFNFVFASEEYPDGGIGGWVNQVFNDVFAFYISGPGITGQENLAVVPGTTTPVTINSINNGSFWQRS